MNADDIDRIAGRAVRRYLGRGIDRDELVSIATLAVLQSARTYSPDRGRTWAQWATLRARYAILAAFKANRRNRPLDRDGQPKRPLDRNGRPKRVAPSNEPDPSAVDRLEDLKPVLAMFTAVERDIIVRFAHADRPRIERTAAAVGTSREHVVRVVRDFRDRCRQRGEFSP